MTAFNYEQEYKKNINKFIHSIKPNKRNEKHIKEEKALLRELLKEVSIPYNPSVVGSCFFVTESRAGVNDHELDDEGKLFQLRLFLEGLKQMEIRELLKGTNQ